MYLDVKHKYKKPVKVIHAGEYYISNKDELIQTLLGSCIAVCLYDPVNKIAGMNHFMLPGKITKSDIFKDMSARYGISAINQLLEGMIKKGSDIRKIKAKLFGGGCVLKYKRRGKSIPNDNIRLAKVMLEVEDIPIVENDTGGSYTRKIILDVKSGNVYCKKTTNKDIVAKVILDELNLHKGS